MKSKHENPFDTLCELALNCPLDDSLSSDKTVRAELRFAEDSIDVGDYDITVSLTSATLHVDAWGSEIAPGSRLGDSPRRSVEETRRIRKQTTARRALELGGRLEVSDKGASAGLFGSRKTDQEDTVELEITQHVKHMFLKPMSGNRWRIREASSPEEPTTLDGTYIANEVLCVVTPKELSNTINVDAIVVARKRDFEIRADGSFLKREYRERVHRDAFMKAIVAKCLTEYSGQTAEAERRGQLIVARSSLRSDDET